MIQPFMHKNSLEPAQFLVENVSMLPKGRVLDLAMGNGRNTIYLVKLGFDVEGIDISYEVENITSKFSQREDVIAKGQAVNLTKYGVGKETYDVIICFYYLNRSSIPQIKNILVNGGMIVYETYIVDQAQFGKPRNPDQLLWHNELLNMFRDLRCLRYREGIFEGPRAIASIIAQKTHTGY